MLDEMCSALGGRASEELNFSKISTGALNDLEKVTKQAYAMTSYFGMSSKIGNLSYYDSTGQREYSFTRPYSEQTAQIIDEEAKKIIEEQYQRALKVLGENKEGLQKLADKLLEKEVIFSEDLEDIFGKRPWHKEEFNGEENNEEKKTDESKTEIGEVEDSSSDSNNEDTDTLNKEQAETNE